MGIDPGTNYMGYGVLEVAGRRVRSVVLGDIDLHKLADPYAKLRYIFERVGALIDEYAPARGGARVALLRRERAVDAQARAGAGRGDGRRVEPRAAGLRVRPDAHQAEHHGPRLGRQGAGRGDRLPHARRRPSAAGASMPRTAWPWRSATTTRPRARSSAALGPERVKGLGGGKKAASRKGSQSWEHFLREHPDREIK